MQLLYKFLVLIALQTVAFAGEDFPTLPKNLICLDRENQTLPFMNNNVMEWIRNTPDQTLKRALIQGTVTDLYKNKTGHTHFAINIDSHPAGDIEIIYNDDFGSLPKISLNMKIVACGDYITVKKGARLPSPMGAIIHWLHYNPGDRDGGKHKHGFLIIDGKPYGTQPKL